MKQMTANQMRETLNAAGLYHISEDDIRVKKGVYTVKRDFFYRHGWTPQKLQQKIQEAAEKVGLKIQFTDKGEVWDKDSYFYVRFSVVAADPEPTANLEAETVEVVADPEPESETVSDFAPAPEDDDESEAAYIAAQEAETDRRLNEEWEADLQQRNEEVRFEEYNMVEQRQEFLDGLLEAMFPIKTEAIRVSEDQQAALRRMLEDGAVTFWRENVLTGEPEHSPTGITGRTITELQGIGFVRVEVPDRFTNERVAIPTIAALKWMAANGFDMTNNPLSFLTGDSRLSRQQWNAVEAIKKASMACEIPGHPVIERSAVQYVAKPVVTALERAGLVVRRHPYVYLTGKGRVLANIKFPWL